MSDKNVAFSSALCSHWDCSWQHLSCSLSSIHFLISCSSLHHCVSLRPGCMSHFPAAFIPTEPISFGIFFSWMQSVINYVLEHVIIPGDVIYYPIHLGKLALENRPMVLAVFLPAGSQKFLVESSQEIQFLSKILFPFLFFPTVEILYILCRCVRLLRKASQEGKVPCNNKTAG